MSEVHAFTPFEIDPDVCDTCGRLQDDHPSAGYAPYKEAIWKWLIDHGEVYIFYGRLWGEANRTRSHLKSCGIDWEKTGEPYMDSIAQFAGTFADGPDYIEAVTGSLFCNCGVVDDQDWVCEEKTLGQIIWEVVKAGERS